LRAGAKNFAQIGYASSIPYGGASECERSKNNQQGESKTYKKKFNETTDGKVGFFRPPNEPASPVTASQSSLEANHFFFPSEVRKKKCPSKGFGKLGGRKKKHDWLLAQSCLSAKKKNGRGGSIFRFFSDVLHREKNFCRPTL